MKRFIGWVRRNSALLIATAALAGVAAPELRDAAAVATSVVHTLEEAK